MFGFGLLLGYLHVRSVALGMSQTLANRIAERQLRTSDGFDWLFVLGRSLAVHSDIVTAPRRTWGVIHGDRARGVLVGFGDLFGALVVDRKRNEATYGQGAQPGDILCDRVVRPKQFEDFYATLEHLVERAQTVEAAAGGGEPAPGPALASDTEVLLSDGVVLKADECAATDARNALERMQWGAGRAPSFAAIARAEELGGQV